MILAVFLIPLTWLLLAWRLAGGATGGGIAEALVRSHLLVFTYLVVTTEGLSLVGRLDYPHLLGVWGLAGGGLALARWWRRPCPSPVVSDPSREFHPYRLEVLVIGGLLVATALAGLLYPPNNWDSMTYHLARVANWEANGDLRFYPTSIDRQLYQMPLAEYAVLHLQVLAGADVYANLVQWVCYAASIGLVALLARELGAGRGGQVLAAVAMATLPMAILQASSTQNDLVVTSFLLAFGWYMLRMRRAFTAGHVLFAALSLGLALLTKGTAWVYAVALGPLLAAPILWVARPDPRRWARRTAGLAAVVLLAVVLTGGHLYRNYRHFGHPFSAETGNYLCRDLGPRAATGNLLRHVALHLGTPNQPFNQSLTKFLGQALGPELDNPDTTFAAVHFLIPCNRHEDSAGNLLHLLVFGIAGGVLLRGVWRLPWPHRWYVVGVLAAGVVFAALLRWNPWMSRLHTPLFALACPLLAIPAEWVQRRSGWPVGRTVAILLAVGSLPFAVNNQTRSLQSLEWLTQPRAQLYFATRPLAYPSYRAVMNLLNQAGVREVGLWLGHDDWEYPFWAMRNRDMRFRHVSPNHPADPAADHPDYILVSARSARKPPGYEILFRTPHVILLVKSGAPWPVPPAPTQPEDGGRRAENGGKAESGKRKAES